MGWKFRLKSRYSSKMFQLFTWTLLILEGWMAQRVWLCDDTVLQITHESSRNVCVLLYKFSCFHTNIISHENGTDWMAKRLLTYPFAGLVPTQDYPEINIWVGTHWKRVVWPNVSNTQPLVPGCNSVKQYNSTHTTQSDYSWGKGMVSSNSDPRVILGSNNY